MKLAFGLSMLFWMPHYWYFYISFQGTVSTSTELWKKAAPEKIISLNMNPEETGSLTISSTKNSKWFFKIGSNWKNNTKQVHFFQITKMAINYLIYDQLHCSSCYDLYQYQ
jgi:hypothetical protein